MSFSPTPRQIVLEEVFDEASLPTDEEIREYALRIGINIENEPHLLYLAQDGLMQALPPGWKPCYDENKKEIYYFNFKSGRAQWEHPLDDVYRNLVKKARGESITCSDQVDEDSRTSIKEDLKSFEEASIILPSSEMYAKPRVLEPLSPISRNSLKKNFPLAPLKKSTSKELSPEVLQKTFDEATEDSKKTYDESEVRKRPNSSDIRNRRNIGPMEFRHLSKQEIITTPPRTLGKGNVLNQDSSSCNVESPIATKDEGYATEFSISSLKEEKASRRKELTLLGGGSAFLRSKTKSSPLSESLSKEEFSESELKGILRDRKLGEEEDDRKSVRFNLEKELKINFEVPELTSSESEENNTGPNEARQIELDFEDLQVELQVDQPKKLKPSQTLIQEFRDIFEVKTKSAVNIPKVEIPTIKKDFTKSSHEKCDNLIDLSQIDSNLKNEGEKENDLIEKNVKLKDEIFDSDFGALVDFAIKRKLFEKDSSEKSGVKGNGKMGENPERDKRQKSEEEMEKAKSDKLKSFEREFEDWLVEANKEFDERKKQTLSKLEMNFSSWKSDQENEHVKKLSEYHEESSQNKIKEMKNFLLKKEKEEIEKMRNQLELEQREKLENLKREMESQQNIELQKIKNAFEQNLNEKKAELMEKHKQELDEMEKILNDKLSEQKLAKLRELKIARENEANIEVMRLDLKENYQKQKNNLMKEHESLLENLKQDHALNIEQLKMELKKEEEAIRKIHGNRIEELKFRLEGMEGNKKIDAVDSQKIDSVDVRAFEKVRCEKRLLEEKYKSLKEKYIRLKSEGRGISEKKLKKKEGGTTTGSETEKSCSNKSKTDYDSLTSKKRIAKKQITNLDNVNQNLEEPKNLSTQLSSIEFKKSRKSEHSKKKEEKQKDGNSNSVSGDEKDAEFKESKKKRQLFSRLKAASISRFNFNNKSQEKEDSWQSPVENLRRQLKKLEELEDQFPVTTQTDTYMRYPFTDSLHFGSSDMEFFKHRIHLERESVRRAKESLKAQKKAFENRQRELKQKVSETGFGSKTVIDLLYQEEKELSEMEVSVHRTRALLGEKIIRLRHLEKSLERISQPLKKESNLKYGDLLARLKAKTRLKEDDGTLSDFSSHSESSGFSSTDFNMSDTHNLSANCSNVEQNRRHFQNNMQESSEIIASLENLNSEIREIWEVLKKQHETGAGAPILPPPPLIYTDLGWPPFALTPPIPFRNTVITSTTKVQRPLAQEYKTQVTGNSNLGQMTSIVDSSLIDRTRNLRDWLKAAKSSSSMPFDVANPNQVTL